MKDFFLFARSNLPNVLISVAKFFDSDFPSSCFDVPKASNFTSGGVQNCDTKNRRLGTIVTSISGKNTSQSFSYCELINLLRNGTIVRCLWENKKTSEKLFFARLGVLSWRHNRSQFPVFGLAVLYPIGSEIWCFWYIKTRERKIAMEKTFLLYLSVHWGALIEQIKKVCHIHFNWQIDTTKHYPKEQRLSPSARVLYLLLFFSFRVIPYGLAVRIPGFLPGGPGSTPGMGICNIFCIKWWARCIWPKFPEIPAQNRMEQKFFGNSFRKFPFTSRGCLFFWKFGNSANFQFHLAFLPGMNWPQFL